MCVWLCGVFSPIFYLIGMNRWLLQESRLKLGIAEASMHMQETSKEAADLIEKLGDSEQQEKTAGANWGEKIGI